MYSSIDESNAYAGVAILLHAKHVKKHTRVHVISGRVIGIDFKMHGRNYCAISTYIPHCGYCREDFDETYNQLRCIVTKAYRSCKRIIVGGDFNTQFGIGSRGFALEQFAEEFDLCITNARSPEIDTDWTFESSMGVRRRLDFVLASKCLVVCEACPSDKLNLGSDHRAVQSILSDTKQGTQVYYRKKSGVKGWCPQLDLTGKPSKYHELLQIPLVDEAPSLQTLEKIIYDAATGPDVPIQAEVRQKPWQSEEIQALIRKRRLCNTSQERASISKQIQKSTRKILRKYQNEKATKLLENFCGLSDLHQIQEYPIKKSVRSVDEIHCEIFAESLKEIFEDPSQSIEVDYAKFKDLPRFDLPEFAYALKKMANRRGSDKSKIVVEMIKHGSPLLHQKLLDGYNAILLTGEVPEHWHITIFLMLPKSGDLTKVGNWRPIAILPILYKVFAKMLYYRLSPILDCQQADAQFGFRRKKRIDDVFVILENMIGKTDEWNVPLWMISLDLRKAFDRLQFGPLFDALREQGLPEAYVQLLSALYKNQKGCVNGSHLFPILRGVKQGDVLSSMLFNAGLESAFRLWQSKLRKQGFLLTPNSERLTNVRYADDVMLFAKTEKELIEMVELLTEAFATVGLELNAAKSKIITNDNIQHSYVDICENLVEIIGPESHHKYLGRNLPGECVFRRSVEVKHRIQCAWYKFGQYKHILTNGKVSIQLRLRLFDAVVTPTILYGLAVLPLSTILLEDIEIVQRKMLRKIVGWVRLPEETWEVTMRRMKFRVNRALQQRPVMAWSERIARNLWKMVLRIKEAPNESWINKTSMWEVNECDDPYSEFLPNRSRGAICLQWDSSVNKFCRLTYTESWQNLSIDVLSKCTDAFVKYLSSEWAEIVPRCKKNDSRIHA